MTIKKFESVFQNRRVGIQDAVGEYAILLPLVQHEGELSLIFEERADTLSGHHSEVCFPGGRLEASESPLEAALRETFEEIGLSNLRIIAPLDVIQDISDRVIYPFLAEADPAELAHLVINSDEVKEVFYVPISALLDQTPYLYTCPVTAESNDFPYERIGLSDYAFRTGTMTVPIYKYQGHIIWGMTGRTVRRLLQVLQSR
ncbi:MAG: CoA pyrophosphatase [Evtepia sp.]